MKILLRFLLTMVFLSVLSGCAIFGDTEDETKGWSASKLASEAAAALSDGEYQTAIRYYELIEARYPFGKYATQAQLNVAYAYYKDDEPESALAAADRFIKLHPQHPYVDYAFYLKGVVNFNRSYGFLERFIPSDKSQRDAGAAMESFKDFRELVSRFPDSEYAPDARKRLLYLRNNIAMHEIHVADYYMRRGAYLAAVNRAQEVVEKYQGTTAVEEALEIMVIGYQKLEMQQLADDAERVLELNRGQGVFDDPTDLPPATLTEKFWKYMELDKN